MSQKRKYYTYFKKNYRTRYILYPILKYFKSILQELNVTSSKNVQQDAIKNIVIANPIKARKLFENNNIDNTFYNYLIIYLDTNINLKYSDSFFYKEMKKNLRSAFNYYNYILQHSRPLDAMLELNKYFHSKNLIGIKKKDNSLPLYIDNIELNIQTLKPVISRRKVSVIMTVYNEEILISHALKSIFKQTYQNLNVIIIDDASTDTTSEKLFEAKKKYGDRLKIITLKENLGTYIAKNIGLTYADGDLITFHDADDWAHPQRIEKHVKAHETVKGLKASISNLVRIKPEGIFFSKHIYPLDRLCMTSLMIDRSIINDIGYFRTHRIGSDSEYFERIKKFGKGKVIKINKVLTFCAHRPNSLTTNNETGVSEFGLNVKREHYWNRWNLLHNKLSKARRSAYIDFNREKYEYKLL